MDKIWQSYEIKGKKISNRIVFPPIATEKSEKGKVVQGVVDYYQRMADTGIGMLVVEHSYINHDGQFSPGQLSIASDDCVQNHQEIAKAIASSKVFSGVQISHAGAHCLLSMQREHVMGPSNVRMASGDLPVISMSSDDIRNTVEDFARSASRAFSAGYDMVEVHSAHGFLLSQFLSPLTNHRKDGYGGSLNARMRLLMEVVEVVQSTIPDEMILAVRLGISDNTPGLEKRENALSLEDGLVIAKTLQEKKIDLLDISGGLCGSRPAQVESDAYFLPFAQAVKETGIRLPIIITGGIQSLSTAMEIIEEGSSDFVGIGRALYQNPDLLNQQKNN
jgi:NADPH2 dehydrogenase